MWKESDNKKLIVRLESSPELFSLLLLMHLGAWGSLLVVPTIWYVKALLVVAVGISLRASLMAHALRRGSGAVVEFELYEDECGLHKDMARTTSPAGVAGVFVHPWLVVLRLRIDGKHWFENVVIVRGATDPDTFRELRVRLHEWTTANSPSKA